MTVFEYSNVKYDDNSAHPFEKLNESVFIERVFKDLKVFMGDSFHDFDFYIFSNHTSGRVPRSALEQSSKKKVLLYFSDEKGDDPSHLSGSYYVIFKSYLHQEPTLKNIFPLSLGYVKGVPELPMVPLIDRKYNVFFRGNLNYNRIEFYKSFSFLQYLLPYKALRYNFIRNTLLKIKNDYSDFFAKSIVIFNKKFKSGLTPAEYGEVLANSKIVLCPKGFDSAECFRHFEAMRAGCIIISEKLPKNQLYNNSPVIQIDNWRQGLKLVENLLMDSQRMEQIHKESVHWWKTKWSEQATARFIYEKLLNLSNDHI